MLKFHVQEYERCANYILPACSLAAGRHIDQTFGVLDVRGVGLRHLTGDVKRMLTRVMSVDQDNFPEMMGHTCIINAPGVFKAIWAFIKPMLDARTQAKVEVCPRDFGPSLLRWVAPENLPEYLGGQSAATLLDDSGPWQVRGDLFLRSFLFFLGGGERGRGLVTREKDEKLSKREEKKTHFHENRFEKRQDPILLAAVETAEAAREGRRHKGGDRGGIAEEGEEEEEGEWEGGTSRRRVVEVEGEESLPLPVKRGGGAPAAASISAAASSADAEMGAAAPRPAARALPPPIAIPPRGAPPPAAAAAAENGDEEEEEEFGTPKSECSFVSAFSTVAAASAAAAAAAANGGGEGAAPSPAAQPVPLLERVHRLEAVLPGRAARARAQSRGASTADPASSQRLSAAADLAEHALGDGRGTLMMRVAQLEAALGALIEAETLLAVGAVEKSHVACCSVM